ncbi:MAG: glycosyltransferase family 2 protein [Marinilabiliaceae bacterium]|nr:glycosyltransferase family 2 protein [Marinilabiliaceae bacterium]
MISVCIPTFNYNITNLVFSLIEQCNNEKYNYEIIVIDDASTNNQIKEQNKIISEFENIQYIELNHNIGRSAIRNLMAQKAQYDYLVFIDADSAIPSGFISNYINNTTNNDVIVGGTSYGSKPKNPSLYLRWLYGVKREVKSDDIRSQNPYKSFTANNFLVNKKLFLDIKFDESLREYGHEDTIFGYELKKRNINIYHINNPLVHLGLEPSLIFIAKTLQAVENLFYIYQSNKNNSQLIEDNKLLLILKRIEKNPMRKLITSILIKSKPLFLGILYSTKPSLIALDLLKLAYILEISSKNIKTNIN